MLSRNVGVWNLNFSSIGCSSYISSNVTPINITSRTKRISSVLITNARYAFNDHITFSHIIHVIHKQSPPRKLTLREINLQLSQKLHEVNKLRDNNGRNFSWHFTRVKSSNLRKFINEECQKVDGNEGVKLIISQNKLPRLVFPAISGHGHVQCKHLQKIQVSYTQVKASKIRNHYTWW